MRNLTRPVAILAASAAMLLSPLALVSGATANSSGSHTASHSASHSTRCTLSPADRAAILDRLTLLKKQLAGTHRPSRAEKVALRASIAELVLAARNAKMSAEVRAAKRAKLATLRASLRAADSSTARVAIRAEIKAIKLELRAARLTHAERAVLRTQAKALKAALYGRPTAEVAKALRVERASLKKSLHCHSGDVSVPVVPGL